MADAAVKMVDAGCEAIAVLGVDFMSENVRAILDDAGKTEAKVYRMAADDIGCSLAEAAQSKSYYAYLDAAKKVIDDGEPAAHVIYINTALDTKANANAVVPTVTCTSSNVVQMVLQLAARCRANVLRTRHLHGQPGAPLRHDGGGATTRCAVHPEHTASSIKALLPKPLLPGRHVRGAPHVRRGRVRCGGKHYGDAYATAHFKFRRDVQPRCARCRGEHGVGSTRTSSISWFEVDEAVDRNLLG